MRMKRLTRYERQVLGPANAAVASSMSGSMTELALGLKSSREAFRGLATGVARATASAVTLLVALRALDWITRPAMRPRSRRMRHRGFVRPRLRGLR